MADMPEYEVYAIKYGDHNRMRSENFLFKDPHDEASSIDFFIWVIQGGARLMWSMSVSNRRKRRPVAGRYTACPPRGCACSAPTQTRSNVVISHLHYDHAGDLDSFPNAQFYLQDREMAYCTGPCMTHAPLRHAYAVDYVVNMVRLVYDDRVQYVDGEMQITGLSVHTSAGTPTAATVRV